MALTTDELIDGQVYHCHDANGEWLFKASSPIPDYEPARDDTYRTFTYGLIVVGQERYEDNRSRKTPSIWIADRNCREATEEETVWFEICDKHKRIIPKNVVEFYNLDNGYYLNVKGLKDNADERLMNNFIEELSFEKFLEDGTPLFKMRNPGADILNKRKEKIKERTIKLSTFHINSKTGLTMLN